MSAEVSKGKQKGEGDHAVLFYRATDDKLITEALVQADHALRPLRSPQGNALLCPPLKSDSRAHLDSKLQG